MKKQILTLAILATLPLTANAIGPNGGFDDDYANVEMATYAPYYEKMTIGNDDRQHIASTAYVKGAYNSAIAAVNKASVVKQDLLFNYNTDEEIGSAVYGAEFIEGVLSGMDAGTVPQQVLNEVDSNLVTTAGVLKGIKSQRATVYTTWDNDNATRQVAFVTASGN